MSKFEVATDFEEAVERFNAALQDYMTKGLKIMAEEISNMDEDEIRKLIRKELAD